MGRENGISITKERCIEGFKILAAHPLFGSLHKNIEMVGKERLGKNTAAMVSSRGTIFVNTHFMLEAKQWAYVIAHCALHLAFGHFDAEKMPGKWIMHPNGKKEWEVTVDKRLWNLACDIYVSKFLKDMKFGKGIELASFEGFGVDLTDEVKIYQQLKRQGVDGEKQTFGTAALTTMDMIGLEKPLVYGEGDENWFMANFADALAYSVADAVSVSGGHGRYKEHKVTKARMARDWFVNHYPLLGSLAAAFEIVEDGNVCMQKEISVAAIDVFNNKIYINPGAKLTIDEMKFVMAHELLHAGLGHQTRRQGRDPYLWNVACDFVINGWLNDLQIGRMPEQGVLYDAAYKDWSAESIYDEIIKKYRKNRKLETFRGYQRGDILDGRSQGDCTIQNGITLDEFCRNALAQGLEYHISNSRGWLPAGLIEEIRALAMPVIPWDVELASWFDYYFPPLEKKYSYARPSRRQGTTPDIPRPRFVKKEVDESSRTFGVIIDTSCSMTSKMLGKALGSIASFAAAKEVSFVRVVFCDAKAYDAGYLSSDDIAGRVEVKGRGGTKLQPGIDLLQQAQDFPKNGPLLIITDGEIESSLVIRQEHAYLIPKGNGLPFKAKGKVFYFS